MKVQTDTKTIVARLTTNCYFFDNLISPFFPTYGKYYKLIQFSVLLNFFPSLQMAALRSSKYLPAINSDNDEEKPLNNQARDTWVRKNQDNYITRVSEEIESRVPKKLSQELFRTENHFLRTAMISS